MSEPYRTRGKSKPRRPPEKAAASPSTAVSMDLGSSTAAPSGLGVPFSFAPMSVSADDSGRGMSLDSSSSSKGRGSSKSPKRSGPRRLTSPPTKLTGLSGSKRAPSLRSDDEEDEDAGSEDRSESEKPRKALKRRKNDPPKRRAASMSLSDDDLAGSEDDEEWDATDDLAPSKRAKAKAPSKKRKAKAKPKVDLSASSSASDDTPSASPAAPLELDMSGKGRPFRMVDLPKTSEDDWRGPKAPKKKKKKKDDDDEDDAPKQMNMTEGVIAAAQPSMALKAEPQRGLRLAPGSEGLYELPKTLSYEGARSRQVLHHLSEVLKHRLSQTINPSAKPKKRKPGKDGTVPPPKPATYKPVEVQAHYVEHDDETELTVSANEYASQVAMQRMTKKEVAEMLEEAASLPKKKKGDPPARRSSAKLLEIEAVNARRRKKKGVETEKDLKRAETLAKKAVSGDWTVAINEDERHAEQTLDEGYKASSTGRDITHDETDVAGTFIRCGACGVQLGRDEVLAHQLTHTLGAKAPDRDILGRFYPRQMSSSKFKAVAPEYAPGTGARGRPRKRGMHVGAPERARSRSPTPERTASTGASSSSGKKTTTTSSSASALPPKPAKSAKAVKVKSKSKKAAPTAMSDDSE